MYYWNNFDVITIIQIMSLYVNVMGVRCRPICTASGACIRASSNLTFGLAGECFGSKMLQMV